ncbi:unnamed protein product [Adineta steineri]|uniref:Uncharacterized protein n=1 Tax=Adineta steineri TaxID=433720 RepID=A0A814G5U3_9BILA|nr:unnamed protein product [Adineta steineri]CAF0989546.1 unnamed protein product [Adineta steineri]
MPPLPKVLVTKVKKHRRHSITHHSKKGRVSNVVRVTRIKSRLDGSFRTNRQSVPSVSKINIAIADVNIKQGVTNDVNQSHILHSTTNRNSLKSVTDSAVPLISSVARQSTLPNRFSSKVVPSSNYDPLRSTIHSNLSSVSRTKQSRFSLGDRRQLFTIERTQIENKKKRKLCPSCSPRTLIALAIVISLVLIAIAIIPATVITLTKTMTTTIATTSSNNMTTTTATTITSNICTAALANIAMVANCYPCPAYRYHQYIYNYTAVANATRIVFAFRRQTAYFTLDDVSVRDYAAPSTELLGNPGFETGNLSSWIYCNQNNETITDGVQSNYTSGNFTYFPNSGIYYYMGGSLTASDYISQAFSTQIVDLYKITLWSRYPGTGNLTSADFFLGV